MDNQSRILFNISKALSHYLWLIDSYNLDFYLDNHWNKIPSKWLECLDQMQLSDIPWLLGLQDNEHHPLKCVLPLTLLTLRALSSNIRMIRSRTYNNTMLNPTTLKNQKHCFKRQLSTPLDHILTRGIKLKKRHEIEQLCKLIPFVMQEYNNDLDIIDFGSGKCHLSRILTLCYDYRVFCIEANQTNINGAVNRETKVLDALKKYRKFQISQEGMPTKVERYLTKEDEIDKLFGDKITRPHLLLGLHACGSLSNLVLEEFIKNPRSKCLILACCCYMNTETYTIPMSQFMKENCHFSLSFCAKELACHAIEKFLKDFNKKETEVLKVHGYRAILETLIEQYCPNKRHQPMKNVKLITGMTFKDYCHEATKPFQKEIQIPDYIFQSDLIENFLQQTDRVVLFYTLRLLIAPLVELFILLDYKRYLSEHKEVKQTLLVPLFEPNISPRNFILIAYK